MTVEPRLSIVIPTRNRPDEVVACLETILVGVNAEMEVVVIDQSDDDTTERALAGFDDDACVIRYHRSDRRGAAHARNEGVELARAPLVAFTDDDCRVASGWPTTTLRIFEAHPEASLVFGRVALPDGMDPGDFAAEFEPSERIQRGRVPGPDVPWGIGANMAVRRERFVRLGMLDPLMGPGAFFPAGEESDLLIRVIAAGDTVVNAAESSVLHLGIRSGAEAPALVRGYAVALGGVFCKHLRLGGRTGSRLLAAWLWHFTRQGVVRIVRRERPTGLGFAKGLVQGAWLAARLPIDRRRGVFAST